jgi:hypothetical protein
MTRNKPIELGKASQETKFMISGPSDSIFLPTGEG